MNKRRMFGIRVNKSTPDIVEQIAKDLGCKRIVEGTIKGSAGVLLDRIASGELTITHSSHSDYSS
jgi:hypothetical protein